MGKESMVNGNNSFRGDIVFAPADNLKTNSVTDKKI